MAALTQGWTDVGQASTVTILVADASMRWIGWGSGTTAFAVAQTALVAANPEARTSGVTTAPTANTRRVIGTIEATAARTVAEVGLFNAAAAGSMGIRGTHTPLPLVGGDRIRYTVDLVLRDQSEP